MKKVKYTALILALIMVLSLAMAPGALAAEDGTVTLICDGSAGYKLAPEPRDADYQGEFYFTQYFGEDVTAGVPGGSVLAVRLRGALLLSRFYRRIISGDRGDLLLQLLLAQLFSGVFLRLYALLVPGSMPP